MVASEGIFQQTIKKLISVWLSVRNGFEVPAKIKERGIFYILMWTHGRTEPFIYWPRGHNSLVLMNCKFQNCYFTDNKSYFRDPTDYDAILFNAPNIYTNMDLPLMRSAKQIYVFVSTESEANFPIPMEFNYFFNYTWSYKLDSDIVLPYFYAKNRFNGKIEAPKTTVNWITDDKMEPTPQYVIDHLQNKSICAAWFVSNCNAKNERLVYARELRRELSKLGLQIDIFGGCDANKVCPRSSTEDCFKLIKEKYFFYLAFENSFYDDYVTEKVMTAVDNFAIPVVYGGAIYSRFLPDGAYLDARQYSPEELALKMDYITKNIQDYYEYFKFHRYYTYLTIGESEDIDPLCTFCKFINDHSIWRIQRVFPEFSSWWNSNVSKMPAVVTTEINYDLIMSEGPKTPPSPEPESNLSNLITDFINYYYETLN